MDGDLVFTLDKPYGIVSNKALCKIKRSLGISKAGFLGTLDPLASGVLPVFTGKKTKLIEYFSATSKIYRAVVEFGKTSPSLDYGSAVTSGKNTNPSLDELGKIIHGFVGEIEQTAPIYSALKVNGVPMYSLARAGVEIKPKTRSVRIFSIDILGYTENSLELRVHCGPGTYIRSLARDIPAATGSDGILKSLVREKVGNIFELSRSIPFDFFEHSSLDKIKSLCIPDTTLILDEIFITAEANQITQVISGKAINLSPDQLSDLANAKRTDPIFLLNKQGSIVSSGRLESSRDGCPKFRPEKVLA